MGLKSVYREAMALNTIEDTARFKIPRIIEFVSELPKTISGKIRRV